LPIRSRLRIAVKRCDGIRRAHHFDHGPDCAAGRISPYHEQLRQVEVGRTGNSWTFWPTEARSDIVSDQHFTHVTQSVLGDILIKGVAGAFRADETSAIGEMVG
jgi:hypothetical protein